jgi:hypothetical protein
VPKKSGTSSLSRCGMQNGCSMNKGSSPYRRDAVKANSRRYFTMLISKFFRKTPEARYESRAFKKVLYILGIIALLFELQWQIIQVLFLKLFAIK